MSPKTIAVATLLVVVTSFARSADARSPEGAKEKRGEAPAAPHTESADNAEKAEKAEKGRTKERENEAAGDDEPWPDGFSIGARAGYALAMGSIAKDASLQSATDLSKTASGMVPFWADIGYRINPHWYLGGYFQLGIVSTAGDWCNRNAANGGNCSSSGTDIRFGAMARYTFAPSAKISPWFGVSSGYELANLSITTGSNTTDNGLKGWEFIGLHLGADFRAAPGVSVGPFVMASFGQYQSISQSSPGNSASSDFNNTSLHEWIFLGLHGQYDL